MNIHCNFISNDLNLEKTSMFINKSMNLQIVEWHTPLKRKKTTDTCRNMDESQNNKLTERSQTVILYDSIYINFQKLQTPLQRKKANQWFPGGWGRSGLQRGKRKLLRVTSKFIILIVVIISQVYIYVKTYQLYTSNTCRLMCISILNKDVKNTI